MSLFIFLISNFLCVPGCGFCAPFGLQNLTPGTPRFTHLCASLRSFKDGSLGIPDLIIYTIDITCSILAGNGLGKYNFVIYNFLFLTVDFVRPFGLQNLTPGTPRFTHFYASLRSFKSGSLGSPGLIIYTIDITCSMLAGNGLSKLVYYIRK